MFTLFSRKPVRRRKHLRRCTRAHTTHTHTHTSVRAFHAVILLFVSLQGRNAAKCMLIFKDSQTYGPWVGRHDYSWVVATALSETANTVRTAAFKFDTSCMLKKPSPYCQFMGNRHVTESQTNPLAWPPICMTGDKTFSHPRLHQFTVYNYESTWKMLQIVLSQMIACAHKKGGKCS